MSYSISQLKTDLQGRLHGTNLNKVQGVDDLISRAARQVLLDVDPQETIRIAQLANAFYDSVYDYPAPSDLKGDKVIDVRPQSGRGLDDSFSRTYGKSFDQMKADNTISIQFDDGIKTLRIAKEGTPGILVNDANGVTDNGTWAVGGAGSSLAADEVYKVTGNASLSFSVTGSSSSYLENSTMTQVDLSDHDEKSSMFVWVYMPTASQVTNVILRWGNDSSNYWSRTVTSAHPTSSFQNGWNLLRFDWNGATETGTVSPSAIDYLRVTVTHTASASGYRVDNVMSILPELYEVVYYSKSLFQTAAGTWQETVTADTNLVNLDTDSYDLLLDMCEVLALRQIQDVGVSSDMETSIQLYQRNLKKYKRNYPTQVLPGQQNYYKFW